MSVKPECYLMLQSKSTPVPIIALAPFISFSCFGNKTLCFHPIPYFKLGTCMTKAEIPYRRNGCLSQLR